MNRKEIDEMMKKDVAAVLKSESATDKWVGGVCFVLFLVLLCLL